MATTCFPTNAAQTIGVVPSPSGWSSATFKTLDTARGAGAVTITINTLAALGVVPVASPSNVSSAPVSATVGVQSGTTAEGSLGGDVIWIRNAIAAVTISGSITVNFRALESNAMANYAAQAHIYKIDGVTGTTTCIGRGGNGTEFGTTEAASSITITPTSTAFADGDYVAVRFFYGSATGLSSASGFTASFFYAGASGATGDCFVTFTEAITDAPAGGATTLPDIGMGLTVT